MGESAAHHGVTTSLAIHGCTIPVENQNQIPLSQRWVVYKLNVMRDSRK